MPRDGSISAGISVKATDNGEILLNWPLGKERMREIEPGHFRKMNGHFEAALSGIRKRNILKLL